MKYFVYIIQKTDNGERLAGWLGKDTALYFKSEAAELTLEEISGILPTLDFQGQHLIWVEIHQSKKMANKAYVHDKTKTAKTYCDDDVNKLLDRVKLISCTGCLMPVFDPTTVETHRGNLCDACHTAKLRAEWAEEERKDEEKRKRQEKKFKQRGFTHRVSAWTHPKYGDDRMVDIYYKAVPTKRDIQQSLKQAGFVILDDYSITTL